MSDNRKLLVAKRKNERSKNLNLTQKNNKNQDFNNSLRPAKRPAFSNDTPKKNLANDRLKRLRTSLNDEASKSFSDSSNKQSSPGQSNVKKGNKCDSKHTRKRLQNTLTDVPVATKVSKQDKESKISGSNGFVFKEENIEKTFSRTVNTDTAKVFNFNQYKIEDKIENMEWCSSDEASSAINSNLNTATINNINQCVKHKDSFYIVVDTNIFLSNFDIIKNIITMKITGTIIPTIFIPWIVIEELDFIKSDSKKTSLKVKAQEAIKFIENILKSKHERLRGQTLIEANEQINTGKNPDDKIIACCLQVLQNYQNMILLTGDINLKNKAHFNNIPVCSHTEIMNKIVYFNKTKADIIFKKMTNLCSTVINECANNAYGPACLKMPICQTSLNSLQDCVDIFTKYWFPVFQECLLKQFKKSIEDLSIFLKQNSRIYDGTNELSELIRLCVRVCLFLKDVDCCKDVIESTIRDLNNLKD